MQSKFYAQRNKSFDNIAFAEERKWKDDVNIFLCSGFFHLVTDILVRIRS